MIAVRCWLFLTGLAMVLFLPGCQSAQERREYEQERRTSLNIAFLATRAGDNFNFLSPTNIDPPPGLDLVYESLISTSPASGWTPEPWLATSWHWSADGRELTFVLRRGVKWSDGKPFTSSDVKFSLDMIRQYPQLAPSNIGKIRQVTAPDPWTIVIAYDQPAFSRFKAYRDMRILPRHIWASQNPISFTNPHPVGTGPFVIAARSYQQIKYRIRSDYWGGPSHGVKQVLFQAAGTSDTIRQYLLTGFIDYTTAEPIGDPKRNFVALDPRRNHYWLASPGSSYAVSFNNAVAPTNNVHLRRALYAAINPGQLLALTPAMADGPANITGLNEPAFTDWIAPQFRGSLPHQNIQAARSELRQSGYIVQNGQLTRNGKVFPLSIVLPAGHPWGDALAQQWQEVLGLTVNVEYSVEHTNRLAEGRFIIAAPVPDVPGLGTPPTVQWNVDTPRPVGVSAGSNWSRAVAPDAVALAGQLNLTNNVRLQKQLVYRIEHIMVNGRFTAPIVPFSWTIAYSSRVWTGWPEPQSPYSVPAAGRSDLIKLTLSLKPSDEKP